MRQKDFIVYVICDGYDNVPESFKSYAQSVGFFDEQRLIDNKFMVHVSDDEKRMKNMRELFDEGVPTA